MEQFDLKTRLVSGALDGSLIRLYGMERLEAARRRYAGVLNGFESTFHTAPAAFFSAPGRTELGGNHTDHQHGHVLAASVDMDILAAAAPCPGGVVRIRSEGYPTVTVSLRELASRPEEKNTSAALVRGMAARFAALGCPMEDAGLEAYVVSDVPGGSGLSSSAAYEVLLGVMMNELFLNGDGRSKKLSPMEIAQAGQWVENTYFGKPCGLMDQTASAVGGVSAIDFADPANPVVDRIELDLRAAGYSLCILDSGADHGDLTDEYAAITDELAAVSRLFGKAVLRDVPEEEFMYALPRVRRAAGDRAVLRAMHFYGEDERAAAQAQALREGDFERFFELVRASGASSAMYLQNIVPAGQVHEQSLMVTIALCQRVLAGRGAVRVHGGGFGGTAQAFVPLDMLEDFKARTESILGRDSCHVLSIRPAGGVMLA